MFHIVIAFIALLQPPPQQQQPVTPGTATIRGHVFAADTGQPLRKAQVRITANEIRESRTATTDAEGTYEFTEVRAGRYTVTASKGSYVTTSYGQQRPTDVAKPIEILDRQTVERLDLTLPRGSIVTGRILDEFGEPMPDILVAVQRFQFVQGRRQLISAGRTAQTNDLGEFRIFGVPPGQYYLTATWRNVVVPTAGNNPNPMERIAFPMVYFPGTANAGEAQRITLRVGQELDDVVMTMHAVKAARVSGTVVDSEGKPFSPAMLMFASGSTAQITFISSAQVKPDGSFSITGLGPGEYSIRAQQMGPSQDGPQTASANLTLNGEDVSDVRMVAVGPSPAKGRVIFDPPQQQIPAGLMFALAPVSFIGIPAPPPPPARPGDDGSIEFKSPPGAMRVALGGFAPNTSGWTIRSVKVNGIDVTDSGIDFRPNAEISGLEIELTNTPSTLSGIVTDPRGAPSTQYTAVVFAQDKEKWTTATRYQGVGRPDQDGRFKISGLPAGDYYIVALDKFEPGQQNDPEFLESVRNSAKSFTLMDGETKTLDLKLTSGM